MLGEASDSMKGTAVEIESCADRCQIFSHFVFVKNSDQNTNICGFTENPVMNSV